MNEVKLPIETTREGNKITKVCVEDVYKIINRVLDALDDTYNNSIEIIDSVHKTHNDYEGEMIIGVGVSEPCGEDEFNEEIGNELAFRKAKLSANLKKVNFLNRIRKEFMKGIDKILDEQEPLIDYIYNDLRAIRKYNPDYLKDTL